MKATRPEIKLVEFADIEVPLFSVSLCREVRRVLEMAGAKREASRENFRATISTLEAMLGVKNDAIPDPLTCTGSIIEVNFAERLDSEFFRGKYRKAQAQLKAKGALEFVALGEMLDYLTNGHTPHKHDLGMGDVPFLTAEHVDDFVIDYCSEKRILREHHEGELVRTLLKTGDILMTIKGRVGNAVLVEEREPFANTNQDVALLRFSESAPPCWYFLAFINSRFGKLEVERWSTGQINPFLGLYNLRRIEVPVFDDDFMRSVGESTRENAHKAILASAESEHLSKAATHAVEIAIEESEAAALRYLRAIEEA